MVKGRSNPIFGDGIRGAKSKLDILKIFAVFAVLSITASAYFAVVNFTGSSTGNELSEFMSAQILNEEGGRTNDVDIANLSERANFTVPIFLNLSTGAGSVSNFQQLITLNRSSLPEINPMFSNIFFTYGNGSGVYAWIQNVSNDTAYVWLNLSLRSNTTLYLDISQENDSLFSNSGYTGLGLKYFNANHVFPFASDFSNGSVPLGLSFIVNNGSYKISNGIDFITNSTNGLYSLAITDVFYKPIGIIADLVSYSNPKGPFPFIGIGNPRNTNDGYGLNINDIGTGTGGTSSGNGNKSWRLLTGVDGLFWFNNSLELYQESRLSRVSNLPLGLNQPFLSTYEAQFGNGFAEKNLTSHFRYVIVNYLPPANTMPSFTFGKVQRTYSVTFEARGIPHGLPWFVNISGNVSRASGPITSGLYTFSLQNGTYIYNVENSSNYFPLEGTGKFIISGKPLSLNVSFIEAAVIRGVVTPWSSQLLINGKAVHYSEWIYDNKGFLVSGIFNLSLHPGNYSLEASNKGYYNFIRNFTLESGEVLVINVTLHREPHPLNAILYIALAIGIIVAVIIITTRIKNKIKP